MKFCLSVALFVSLLTVLSRPVHAQPRSVADISRDARSAVVVITCGDGMGTGFIALAPQYVVTVFHVVESGRDVHVRFVDGSEQIARIKAVDRSKDLAILELAHPRPNVNPLVLDTREPEIGAPVVAIGHPYGYDLPDDGPAWKGLLEWSVTTGVISAASPTRIQTDTSISPGSSGAPLLGADGTVVGVIDGAFEDTVIGFAIRASQVTAFAEHLATAEPYSGEWTTSFILTPLTLHLEGRGPSLTSFPAVALGLEVVGNDRYTGALHVGMVSDDTTLPSGSPVFSREHQRFYAEATIGYRHLMVWQHPSRAVVLGVAVGGMLARDRITEETLQLAQVDPACTGTCAVATTVAERRDVSWNLRPFASVTLERRSILLQYGIAIDPTDPADRTQQLSVAIRF